MKKQQHFGKAVSATIGAFVMSASAVASAATLDVNIAGSTDGLTSFAGNWVEASLAQTFKAGFTQILSGVELTHDVWGTGQLVDVDVSIYHVTSPDSPMGERLAQMHVRPEMGTAVLDFQPYGVQLTQGETYSLVLENAWGNVNGVGFTPGNHDADWNYTDSYADGMLWSRARDGEWVPFTSWISHDAAGTSDLMMKTFGQPVPEPSTMLLMPLGLFMLSQAVRKKGV